MENRVIREFLTQAGRRCIPFTEWIKDVTFKTFARDLVAGLTVAVVLIPQSMALAMLAGMPPVYGLYTASMTPIVGALWGSLRQLATGPIAITSLLVLTSVSPHAEPGSERFIEIACLLALLVGTIYLVIALLRFGIFMSFISHAVVKGFTSAAALIIIATQLPGLLGVHVDHHEYIFPMLVDIGRALPATNLTALGIGALGFVTIYGIKRINQRLPASLFALVFTTLAVILLDLEQNGIAIVGFVPSGFPSPSLPALDFEILSTLFGSAVVIALVSFAETYSVGKSITDKTKQRANVNQEFFGQGMANVVSSLFHGFPVSGSFSRTAINYAAGAKTGISGIISGLMVIASLLFLTPLFTHVPRAALSALVISAVLLLFRPWDIVPVWKTDKKDGAVALLVFVLALFSKPDYALLIGIIISLMFYLWKTMHPRVVRITKDPFGSGFLNANRHHNPVCDQIMHLRGYNSLYFGNAEYYTEIIRRELEKNRGKTRFLLLDFEAVGFVDSTALDELELLLEEVKKQGISIGFIDIHRPVEATFECSGILQKIQPIHVMRSKGEAIRHVFSGSHLDYDYCKNVCPFRVFKECPTEKKGSS